MGIFELLKDEWDKLTVVGRITLFPVLAIIIPPLCIAIMVLGYPLYLLSNLIEKPTRRLGEMMKKLIYRHHP